MDTKNSTLLLTLLIGLGLPTSARAADISVTLDPADTRITFELRATGHDVEGVLHLHEGHLVLSDDGKASGSLEIDAGQTATGNKRRDKTMHAKVLESVDHPLISFTAERYEGRLPEHGHGDLKLYGKMLLAGHEHDTFLPISVEVEGDHFSGTSDVDVPFVEWGLHDPSILFLRVKKIVNVHVKAQGRLTSTANDAETVGATDALSTPESRR